MDTALDKVRERTRKSVDERRGSDESASANRLSSLLERGARKLKRKEKNNDNNDGASTLAVNHSGESGELAFSDGGRSEGSLLDEDGHSSLLTDDGSDNEGYVQHSIICAIRPCLRTSSHRNTQPLCYLLHACQHRHPKSSAPALAQPERELCEGALASSFHHALTCPDRSTLPMLNAPSHLFLGAGWYLVACRHGCLDKQLCSTIKLPFFNYRSYTHCSY
jgi:hypothetical protein